MLPYVLLAAGAALTIAGTATYDWGPGKLKCGEFDCHIEDPDNSSSFALTFAGVATTGTGFLLKSLRPSTKVKDIKTLQKSASTQGPCLQVKDLGELKLVLQIANRKFLSIRVNRDWTARIVIPPGVELPRNVDLPVLVYHVPRSASTLVGRWHLLGYARAGADAAPGKTAALVHQE